MPFSATRPLPCEDLCEWLEAGVELRWLAPSMWTSPCRPCEREVNGKSFQEAWGPDGSSGAPEHVSSLPLPHCGGSPSSFDDLAKATSADTSDSVRLQ